MLATERQKIIIDILKREKAVVVSQLADNFRVSGETIRRDLERICRDGIAIKSHGGAVLNEAGSELPFAQRKSHNFNEKQRIAGLVAEMVNDGNSIMLDASTTAVFVARALKNKNDLTIITNSVDVAMELADMRDWTIYVAGGRLIGDYVAMIGERVARDLAGYCVDLAIFSCKALSIDQGIFDSRDDFSAIKRAMLAAAKTKILATDQSKFGKTALSKIADFAEIDAIITDSRPDANWLEFFAKQKIECRY
ncbi:MAG: DeoR/GlpR family DNA-binding transcription regulator [Defluviitaleaceae bacterium]|nr:DeoR/GlpR family DNA-binding transcription regulator [Defluviitaleaceae bacterium]